MAKPYVHGKYGEYPPYTKQDSVDAITKYHADKTPESLQHAVHQNLRLAAWVTYKSLGRRMADNLTDDEIYSVCCQRIEVAIRKFDPSRGVSFSTFATRVLFSAIGKENARVTKQADRFSTSDESRGRVERLIDHRPCASDELELQEAVSLVEDWVKKNLSPRMQIIYRDRADGVVLHKTAAKLGVTKERIRQLHNKIVKRITEEFDFLKGPAK